METYPALTTTEQKVHFIRHNLIQYLKKLSAGDRGQWGVMNAQQMIEHLTYSMRVSNGKDNQQLKLPPEQSEKVRAFFLSEKLFKENTKNSLLPETPFPVRNANITDAIHELEIETMEFELFFCQHPLNTTVNPLAGPFNYEEWVQLHYKHLVHHLRQFGLV